MSFSLEDIGFFFLIVNTVLFLVGLKKAKNKKEYYVFTIYLISISVISGIMSYLASYEENNLFLSHYYFVVQFILLSWFFYELFQKRQKKLVVKFTGIVVFTLAILYLTGEIAYYSVEPFNPLEVFICSFPIIVYSIIHLYNSLNNTLNYAYVNTGILVYISISTLVFILASVLNNPESYSMQVVDILWEFNSAFFLLYHVLIFVEWLKKFQWIKVK
ncbi:hypothetical protein [Winogradskyella haliclonae]|uniref:YhhN-like protein n=1 Tax=Winogradskyella haliclonae TaxID=2048558 RepID=A0ABQ2BVR0_9FLAO|nr:hypothetical protein [Winogradskyella haliclonae]GGI56505.1 hypothetical protein GCM10011444_08140 [Winogradskyella haliclonae]